MKTRVLGNSDLNITPIGFGAWAIGGDWQFGWGAQDDTQSIAAIHRALELGVNWIDTAPVYGLGHSEEVVARALHEWKGARPYVFTKCGMLWNDQGEISYSLHADSVRRECEASLRRLKTDVIDLYQIHWTADDLNETIEGWNTLAALQKEGKVRWIGLSNASVEEMQKLQSIARITLAATAVFAHPARRGIGTTAVVPARKGRRDCLFADGVRSADRRDDARTHRVVAEKRLAQPERPISRNQNCRKISKPWNGCGRWARGMAVRRAKRPLRGHCTIRR